MESPSRVLVLFSNPGDTSRIRLDKEDRAITKVVKELNLDDTAVRRLHAVTLRDFAQGVWECKPEIIQFSGHGSDEGIYLERDDHNGSELVGRDRLAAIIRGAPSPPRVLLLMSCFSTSTVGALGGVAPYLITVSGAADDDACAEFSAHFHREYLGGGNVERSFQAACLMVSAVCPDSDKKLRPVLSRRATTSAGELLVVVSAPESSSDTVLVDTTQAEADICELGVSRDEFLAVLCRKIRVHRWVFTGSSEGSVLSVGPYFGVFAWTQAVDDLVTLRRVLRLREEVTESEANVLAGLVVTYNDLRARKYRQAPQSAILERELKRVIDDHYGCLKEIKGEWSDTLRSAVPEEFKATAPMIEAHLRQADSALNRGETGYAVRYVETSLTTIHDLVDALLKRLTERPHAAQGHKAKGAAV